MTKARDNANGGLGLILIKPSSVVNGTDNGKGTISFSGVNSVSLNDVFSSTYTNYKILVSFSATQQTDLCLRFRVAGSDNASSNYYTVKDGWSYNNGSVGFGPNTLYTLFLCGNCNTNGYSSSVINVFDPFTSNNTSMVSQFQGRVDGASVFSGGTNGGQMTVTTSYTGFSLLPGSGNFSGTVSVYGINK